MYWNQNFKVEFVNSAMFNNNIRCIEIKEETRFKEAQKLFNNNIRCIEIKIHKNVKGVSIMFNNNIRCIEIKWLTFLKHKWY